MIGILIITHGTLGESLIQCICHVINKRPPHIAQLGIAEQDAPQDALDEARRLLASVDDGEGVLILTDIYGATPANIAMKLLIPGKVEGVAGVSIPMLLRVLTYREKSDIQTVVHKAISGGCDGVLHIKGGF
ncbi:PTS fructose transporter subunit IIA [Uliginosibacterium sp. 31-16]|uniref:PTS sugar transporter subunit IIA n=1 Tax=Uliginosibacterium sp. 31-16 TaxID=3068315 RepID=UPI00273CFA87|nr:PTS fructose transporter subunit IIA [Uliginosibacterium sp. 31-16]MDP5238525.1 PTS fructose transporter subunit IIA [Uliginosibacterium sp. 31-16]